MTTSPDVTASLQLDFPLDLGRTLGPLGHGRGDPTTRVAPHEAWRGMRTAEGPATLRLVAARDRVVASAWGPGATAAVASAADLVGARDDPGALEPRHPVVAELARRHAGLRLTRSGQPWEALLPAICEQKVTGDEARRAYRSIVRRWGEPAPGPGNLLLAPEPSVLAGQPYFAFHPLGLERRRADVVRSAAAVVPRLPAQPAEAERLLGAVSGIGPWTLAEVRRVAFGDPDAVSVGDYHLPNLVAWVLAGEPRADDERMLELLEPYRGQRGRVQVLLEVSGLQPPRYGPRLAPRRIAAI